MEPIITADGSYLKNSNRIHPATQRNSSKNKAWAISTNYADAQRCDTSEIDYEYFERKARRLRSEAIFHALTRVISFFLTGK